MSKVTRRSFVTTVGAASVVPGAALLAASHSAPPQEPAAHAASPTGAPRLKSSRGAAAANPVYIFFNAAEALFIEAACERLIPADELGPGALAAWVPNYLDKQLGGAWGAGERLYRSGPWREGTPTQGYQLPFTPAELFHTALRASISDLAAKHTPFNEMSASEQDTYLKSLESGLHDLDGIPSAVFFGMLLEMTVEGFFSDPVYGGNRDMLAWRMIGFPGAYANYFEVIDRHGVKFEREPLSLAEDGKGQIHMRQDIPANL
jgi:gluconate 2-dehydrogenase gamma chain